MRTLPHQSFSRGSLLVELLVALAMIVTVFISAYGALFFSERAVLRARTKGQATFLLEESAEGLRFLRDAGWVNVATPALAISHCFTFNTGTSQFAFSAPPCAADAEGFTRTVTFHSVCRQDPVLSASDDHIVGVDEGGCPAGSSVDTKTRRVRFSVTWLERGDPREEKLEMYIADIFGEAP